MGRWSLPMSCKTVHLQKGKMSELTIDTSKASSRSGHQQVDLIQICQADYQADFFDWEDDTCVPKISAELTTPITGNKTTGSKAVAAIGTGSNSQ
ncbi:hypothetical protein TNCV_1564091 [Trichonephila clavipes]|nr:hypothetical protein TNCV_1564091 [Trichonephila clavipes]